MALSVIVTSYESPATLRRCLRALSEQAEASEIVVSDCSSKNPSSVLEPEFPASGSSGSRSLDPFRSFVGRH